MRVAFKALAEYLQVGLDSFPGARVTVHRDYAYGVSAPYVVLTAGASPTSSMLGGQVVGANDGSMTAICVGVTADQARWVADNVRSVLSPDLRPLRFTADGRHIEVSWRPSDLEVEVDRDMTLPGTSTHPAVVHEFYRYSAHRVATPDHSGSQSS